MNASQAMWPPSWNQFIPDLIVAAFTGLLIGLALAWLQQRGELTRTRRRYREELSRIVPAIAPYFDVEPTPVVEKWNYYEAFDPLVTSLREIPLGEWARLLDRPLIRHLEKFEVEFLRFRAVCSRLEDPTTRAVMASAPADLPLTQRAQRYSEAATAVRAIVLNLDFASKFVEPGGDRRDHALLTWAKEAMLDRHLSAQIAEYNATRTRLDHEREEIARLTASE